MKILTRKALMAMQRSGEELLAANSGTSEGALKAWLKRHGQYSKIAKEESDNATKVEREAEKSKDEDDAERTSRAHKRAAHAHNYAADKLKIFRSGAQNNHAAMKDLPEIDKMTAGHEIAASYHTEQEQAYRVKAGRA